MDSLIQTLIVIFLTGLYGLMGVMPLMIFMATVTYIKKDKAYFRKKMDKFIGGKNGKDINFKQ